MDATIFYFDNESNNYKDSVGITPLYVRRCFNAATLEVSADEELVRKLAEWDLQNGANPNELLNKVLQVGGAGVTMVSILYNNSIIMYNNRNLMQIIFYKTKL